MKISVIIPTYRPGEYMRECIESLVGQTLSHADFEVLVVLNGCREPFYEQLSQWLGQTDLQWRLIQTDHDFFSPSYLDGLLECVDESTPSVAMIRTYEETTGRYGEDYLTYAYHRRAPLGEVSLMKGRTFMSTCCGKLLPREIIGERRFPEQFRMFCRQPRSNPASETVRNYMARHKIVVLQQLHQASGIFRHAPGFRRTSAFSVSRKIRYQNPKTVLHALRHRLHQGSVASPSMQKQQFFFS